MTAVYCDEVWQCCIQTDAPPNHRMPTCCTSQQSRHNHGCGPESGFYVEAFDAPEIRRWPGTELTLVPDPIDARLAQAVMKLPTSELVRAMADRRGAGYRPAKDSQDR